MFQLSSSRAVTLIRRIWYNAAVIATIAFPAFAYAQSGRLEHRGHAICGATLIGDHQVVTAAHCLFDRETGLPLPISDLSDIDVVMECTGRADCPEPARRGLRAGARRVLISGPSDAAEVTVVMGANDAALTPAHQLVSNASCTTNALAPLVRFLHDRWGLATGFMTTVHCYTGSQPTVDAPRGDLARSRAAALSMVPTTTSAQRLVERVLPELEGRLLGAAVRVPTASVSAVDLSVMLDRPADSDTVNAALRDAGGVIGWTERPLVSTDLRARSESVVMALPETAQTRGGLLRLFGWYDNEWGFSCRMLDMATRMGAQG